MEPNPQVKQHASLGEQMKQILKQVAAGKQPSGGVVDPSLRRGILELLEALRLAYSEPDFQTEVRRLHLEYSGSESRYLMALAGVAQQVQNPVFERFGLPGGSRGVFLMKATVKDLAEKDVEVERLAGDLREMLCLPRVEKVIDPMEMLKAKEESSAAAERELQEQIGQAPVQVRAKFASMLGLPTDASPAEIAAAVPKIKQLAQESAEKAFGKGRSDFIGEGKLLAKDMWQASDADCMSALHGYFEHFLRKMLTRVLTRVQSFTIDAACFRCRWANALVKSEHVEDLWGSPSGAEACATSCTWHGLAQGLTVIEDAIPRETAQKALQELKVLESSEALQESTDPCNRGARSVWLHFEKEEEQMQIPPTLRELCLGLAGLPSALQQLAEEGNYSHAPRMWVHPHIMAATYKRGASYHCHKDSYDGTDNQRILTVLLYLNDWMEGDGGQLRVFGTKGPAGGSVPADEESYVDLAPLSGRLVMFRARDTWHAVLEPREQRWALTLWVMAE